MKPQPEPEAAPGIIDTLGQSIYAVAVSLNPDQPTYAPPAEAPVDYEYAIASAQLFIEVARQHLDQITKHPANGPPGPVSSGPRGGSEDLLISLKEFATRTPLKPATWGGRLLADEGLRKRLGAEQKTKRGRWTLVKSKVDSYIALGGGQE